MSRRPSAPAFSLIEVIVAVAVFASAIAVILALLPALTSRGTESSDRLIAQGLPDAIHAELARVAAPGLDGLADQVPVMGATLAEGLALVATHDGSRVQMRDLSLPAVGRLAEGDRYFLIECWRFPTGELRYDGTQASLALAVRITWPYRTPGAPRETPVANRHEFLTTIAINR